MFQVSAGRIAIPERQVALNQPMVNIVAQFHLGERRGPAPLQVASHDLLERSHGLLRRAAICDLVWIMARQQPVTDLFNVDINAVQTIPGEWVNEFAW